MKATIKKLSRKSQTREVYIDGKLTGVCVNLERAQIFACENGATEIDYVEPPTGAN